jgi:hypothetical protein
MERHVLVPCHQLIKAPSLKLSPIRTQLPRELDSRNDLAFLTQLGMKQELKHDDWITMLYDLRDQCHGTINSASDDNEQLFNCYYDILKQLAKGMVETASIPTPVATESKNERPILILGDENVLHDIKEVFYRNNNFLKQIPDGLHEISSRLPHDLRKQLGVKSLTEVLHLDDGHFESFGQQTRLVPRLRNIIGDYHADTIAKELLQNADDSGADTVHFVLDLRQHRSVKLIGSEMKSLQGPALVVYNNRPFTDEDFKRICSIDDSAKRENAFLTGQFGVGFNSIYHLTDSPVICSGPYTCFLDPTRSYLPGAMDLSNDPGGRYFTKKNAHLYPDQFAPLHFPQWNCTPAAFDEKKFIGTVFRFPLRTKTENDGLGCMMTPDAVKNEVLSQLTSPSSRSMLLFLKNIRHITVSQIDAATISDGETPPTLRHLFDTQCHTSRERAIRNFLAQDAQLITSQLGKGTNVSQVETLTISTNRFDKKGESKNNWLVHQSIDASSGTKLTELVEVSSRRRRLPWVGIAVPLEYDVKVPYEGGLYCFLPMNEQPKLPFDIHAFVDLTSSRGLDPTSLWNGALFVGPLVKSFMELLEHARLYVSKSLSSSTSQSSRQLLSWYRRLFPLQCDPKWQIFISAVYTSLFNSKLPFYPLIPSTPSTIPSSESKSVEIKKVYEWISINDGIFCEKKDPAAILVRCGMKLIDECKAIADFFRCGISTKLQQQVRVLSREMTCKYLQAFSPRMIDATDDERLKLLEWLVKGDRTHLQGVPLLILESNEVVSFDPQSIRYLPQEGDHDLLPNGPHLFVHSKVRQLFMPLPGNMKDYHAIGLHLLDAKALVSNLGTCALPMAWKNISLVSHDQITNEKKTWLTKFWSSSYMIYHNHETISLVDDWPLIACTNGNWVRCQYRLSVLSANHSISFRCLFPTEVLTQLGFFILDGPTTGNNASLINHVSGSIPSGILKAFSEMCKYWPGAVPIANKLEEETKLKPSAAHDARSQLFTYFNGSGFSKEEAIILRRMAIFETLNGDFVALGGIAVKWYYMSDPSMVFTPSGLNLVRLKPSTASFYNLLDIQPYPMIDYLVHCFTNDSSTGRPHAFSLGPTKYNELLKKLNDLLEGHTIQANKDWDKIKDIPLLPYGVNTFQRLSSLFHPTKVKSLCEALSGHPERFPVIEYHCHSAIINRLATVLPPALFELYLNEALEHKEYSTRDELEKKCHAFVTLLFEAHQWRALNEPNVLTSILAKPFIPFQYEFKRDDQVKQLSETWSNSRPRLDHLHELVMPRDHGMVWSQRRCVHHDLGPLIQLYLKAINYKGVTMPHVMAHLQFLCALEPFTQPSHLIDDVKVCYEWLKKLNISEQQTIGALPVFGCTDNDQLKFVTADQLYLTCSSELSPPFYQVHPSFLDYFSLFQSCGALRQPGLSCIIRAIDNTYQQQQKVNGSLGLNELVMVIKLLHHFEKLSGPEPKIVPTSGSHAQAPTNESKLQPTTKLLPRYAPDQEIDAHGLRITTLRSCQELFINDAPSLAKESPYHFVHGGITRSCAIILQIPLLTSVMKEVVMMGEEKRESSEIDDDRTTLIRSDYFMAGITRIYCSEYQGNSLSQLCQHVISLRQYGVRKVPKIYSRHQSVDGKAIKFSDVKESRSSCLVDHDRQLIYYVAKGANHDHGDMAFAIEIHKVLKCPFRDVLPLSAILCCRDPIEIESILDRCGIQPRSPSPKVGEPLVAIELTLIDSNMNQPYHQKEWVIWEDDNDFKFWGIWLDFANEEKDNVGSSSPSSSSSSSLPTGQWLHIYMIQVSADEVRPLNAYKVHHVKRFVSKDNGDESENPVSPTNITTLTICEQLSTTTTSDMNDTKRTKGSNDTDRSKWTLEEKKARAKEELKAIWSMKLTNAEYKRAGRRLILKWHPDKNIHDEYDCTEVSKFLIDLLTKWGPLGPDVSSSSPSSTGYNSGSSSSSNNSSTNFSQTFNANSGYSGYSGTGSSSSSSAGRWNYWNFWNDYNAHRSRHREVYLLHPILCMYRFHHY